MAGRTGRNGNADTAFTLVRLRDGEIRRLVAFADALVLKFRKSLSRVVVTAGRGGTGRDRVEDDGDGRYGGGVVLYVLQYQRRVRERDNMLRLHSVNMCRAAVCGRVCVRDRKSVCLP